MASRLLLIRGVSLKPLFQNVYKNTPSNCQRLQAVTVRPFSVDITKIIGEQQQKIKTTANNIQSNIRNSIRNFKRKARNFAIAFIMLNVTVYCIVDYSVRTTIAEFLKEQNLHQVTSSLFKPEESKAEKHPPK